MTEENALSTNTSFADLQSLIKAEQPENNAVANMVNDYLPYVQLFGGNSKACQAAQIGIGHFGVTINKELHDLGDEFQCLIFAARPKAMQYSPDVVSVFDDKSEEFQRIKSESAKKDSQCGFGPELLLYIPDHNVLAAYFLGNKTGRNASSDAMSVLQNGTLKLNVKSKLIETKDYSWHGPVFSPFDHDVSMPDGSVNVLEEVRKFNNPPAREGAELAQRVEASSDDARS